MVKCAPSITGREALFHLTKKVIQILTPIPEKNVVAQFSVILVNFGIAHKNSKNPGDVALNNALSVRNISG